MKHLRTLLAALAIVFTVAVAVIFYKDLIGPGQPLPGNQTSSTPSSGNRLRPSDYPVHKDITVSVFWVGESADRANNYISNTASAWDENWQDHFGGEDDPYNRNGLLPAGFSPQENPFYFALPYNDLDSQGNRKPEAAESVYWSADKEWGPDESMCKNQWIKISKNGLNAYAQWEDVGPFGENDAAYVFGSAAPSNTQKSEAGLDVSPAVRDYLGISGIDKVNWQFVPESNVPAGPWKQVITTRNGN